MTQCDARIRPFPNATELTCERQAPHATEMHQTALRDYAFPGSVTLLSWEEADRRTFRGEWRPCCDACSLPLGHHGRCAP